MPNHLNKLSIMLLFLISALICSCNYDSKAPFSDVNQAVSMLQLINGKNIYNNKHIEIIGYTNIDSGVLAVYPFRDSYISRDNLSSIELDLGYKDAVNIVKQCKDRYCQFEGTIKYEDSNIKLRHLGLGIPRRLGILLNPRLIDITDTNVPDDVGRNEILYRPK
jgi:hypothetical protein